MLFGTLKAGGEKGGGTWKDGGEKCRGAKGRTK